MIASFAVCAVCIHYAVRYRIQNLSKTEHTRYLTKHNVSLSVGTLSLRAFVWAISSRWRSSITNRSSSLFFNWVNG